MSVGAIILLIVLGIILLFLEFFVIPGVTIAGIGGFLCLAGAIFAAYYNHGTGTGNIILLSTIVVLIILIFIAFKSNIWKKVMLNTDIDGIATDVKNDPSFKIGDRGMAITRLAPIGKAMFNNKMVEAKSIAGFIDQNTEVEIVKIQNTNVIVKPLK